MFKELRISPEKIFLNEGETGAVARMCSAKKVFLENLQNPQENICVRVSAGACSYIKKETLTQVFSCEFLRNF